MALGSLALAAAMLSASAASAQDSKQYFPLKKGNSWTYQNLKWGTESTMKVTAKYYDIYKVEGLLGDKLWVGFGGSTLWAWDEDQSKWVPLFRFGAPVGTKYKYGMMDVTVESKNLTFYDSVIDTTFTNCIRFTFHTPGLYDAGLIYMVFAPKVGLVGTANQSIIGPVATALKSAVVNGKKFGFVAFKELEKGSYTQYTGSAPGTVMVFPAPNQVLLFNTKATWEAFYKKHNPGQPVPEVNFYKNTVAVVLAGARNSGGYSVEVTRTTDYEVWNQPLRISVQENKPGPGVIVTWAITRPFQIVVLDRKVYNVKVDWKVVTYGPQS